MTASKDSTTNPKGVNALTIRSLLVTILVILVIAGGSGFYFVYRYLENYSTTVSQLIGQAQQSRKISGETVALQQALNQQADISGILLNFYSNGSTWQADATRDINNYASATGVDVSDISFDNGPAPAIVGQANQPHSVTVKVTSPTSYSDLLNFMTNIRYNLPKMRIVNLTLKHVPGGTADSVEVDSINIEVYTK